MGKNQSASNLTNIIKQDANGSISFMHGNTMLMQVSSSGAITTTGVISGSNALSASYAESASAAASAVTAVTAQTASFANAFTVAGNLTAQTLVVQTITSSVDFVTGSTRFGSIIGNTHVFTGSIQITSGSINNAVYDGSSNSKKWTIGDFTSGTNYNTLELNAYTEPRIYFNTDGGGNLVLYNSYGNVGLSLQSGSYTNDIFYYDHFYGGKSLSIQAGGSTRLFISGSGEIGIGTTTPSYRLHVSGAFSSNPGLYVYGTTYGMVGVDRGSSASSAGVNYYTTGSQRWFTGIYENTNNFGFYNALSANFPMVITTGSNVGIGITSPNNRLSVNGNADFGTTSYSFNGPSQYGGLTFPRGQIFFSNTNTQNQLYIAGNAYNNASGVFAYRNSTQPATAIGLDNGAFSFLTAGNGTADAAISWTTVMAITNGGDVTMGGTGAIKIQSGTTAQRPSAATGQIRYNTSFNFLEYYDGSNWVPVVGQTSPGSSASNPAESADEIKTYNPNATNGLYWIRQIGTTPIQAYCVFTDYNGSAIAGGPWTVPLISNDANSNFSTNGPSAAATFLSKCQAIGIASPGRGMENTRTTTEVYGAWLAVKRALWNGYSSFITNGDTGGGSVLRMPMININGEGGSSDHRLIYNTSLGTHLPPNESGDACNAGQLFCGWWGSTDTSGWRTNNNTVPGPEDWGPSDSNNSSYNGNGIQSVLTVCVYK